MGELIDFNSCKAIVSIYNKVDVLKNDIEILENIRNSNTFIMTVFLGGDETVNNYSMSITSDNIMNNNNGELYQSFIDGLLESKKKELISYNNVLLSFEEKMKE